MINIYNIDNMNLVLEEKSIDLIYADMIYENADLKWISRYWEFLKKNGVMEIQTDHHTSAQVKLLLDSLPDSFFINEVIYKQEWGGTPKKGFPKKHDNIYIYSKGEDFKWHGDRIQIAKKTAGTKFDKKGTGLKTPCSVFDDLGNFSTMALERIKNPETGKNIQWQKSLKLMNRLLLPFTDENDAICDPFSGSGTTAVWCKENNRNFVGCEYDKRVYDISLKRLGIE